MEATPDPTDSPGPLFHPLTGWEAASRWNAAAFDWMSRGFEQWLALVTMPLTVAAATRLPRPVPGAPVKPADRPVARGDEKPKRSSRAAGARRRSRG
jgi:hypothetical protein